MAMNIPSACFTRSPLLKLPEGLDSTEFSAIVGNFLDNAFDASLKNLNGNKIVELFLSDDGPEVIIEVTDNGCGVPEALRELIFERGVSTKTDNKDAQGIGLYLVVSYVNRCGGITTLEDNEPNGSLFSVFIPKVKKINDPTD